MRWPWYIHRADGTVYFEGPDGQSMRMPEPVLEELAAMVWLRIPEDQRDAVLRRTAEQHGGNLGADGVMRELGEPTVLEIVNRSVREAITEVPDAD